MSLPTTVPSPHSLRWLTPGSIFLRIDATLEKVASPFLGTASHESRPSEGVMSILTISDLIQPEKQSPKLRYKASLPHRDRAIWGPRHF